MASMKDAVCSVPPSSVYDYGTRFFTLLCCSYALTSTAFGQSVSFRNIRVPGYQAKFLIQNMEETRHLSNIKSGWGEQVSYALTDNVAHNRDIRENRDSRENIDNRVNRENREIKDNRDNTIVRTTENSSLAKLLRINNWASQNRIQSANFGQRAPFLNSSTEQNSSLNLKRVYHKRIVKPYDKKVFVYGKDDRLRIYPSLLRKFPYSNVVRLSSGCTGTLVTPQHVLTAAHCVHTGVDFRNNLEMLKVEIPDSMGVRSYYIEKIGIPGKWLQPKSKSINEHQASWDYAVVKLSYGVHGRSQFFPLAVPTAGVLNENLQFLGFPNNKDDLWLSVCPARSNKAMVDGNLILTRCDSAVGDSGAAVLSDDSREGKKIIGVLSSTMPVGRMPFYTQFSIITALTWAKLYDICAEIGQLGVQHRVCPPLEAIPRPRRYHISNNVIPFFG